MSETVKVGLIGCGAISANYLKNARSLPILEFAAVSDLDPQRARERAEEFGVPKVLSVDELLADPEIELVLNLTVPQAHAALALRSLEAGKHHYTEKPLATDREQGRAVLEAAQSAGLRIGGAPDTFLGAGLQMARRVLDEESIGRPVAFTAFFMGRGPESFHPDPAFFYQPGAGPMFDMGPYYLTALLNLLGPVKRISGAAAIEIPDRVVAKGSKAGEPIPVVTPDHVCGLLEFECGAVGTLITSFAISNATYDREYPITVYGTEGTLKVPDPNYFDGVVQVRRAGEEDWQEVPNAFHTGYGRSIGLADMAQGIRSGRPHRCSGEQVFAVLDLMQGFLESSESGQAVIPSIEYRRPEPMRPELPFGELDI